MALLRLMTGLSPGALFAVALLNLGTGLGFVLLASVLWPPAVYAALAFCAPTPCVLLIALLRYPAFRGWQKRLPFDFESEFDRLAADRTDSDSWRHCDLAIELTGATAEQAATTARALNRLVASANRTQYKTRWGRMERWTAGGGAGRLSASGDANSRTAWKLYRWIRGDLVGLHAAGVPLRVLRLRVSVDATQVMSESDIMGDPA